MTTKELYKQFKRLQERNLRGWRTNKECEMMARGWHSKFAHIDADICEQEMTIELGQPGFPSVGNVHARCLIPQGDRDYYAKKAAEPEPERPGPWTTEQKIKWRAVIHTLGEHPLTQAEAEAQARKEIEAEEAGKGGE